MAALPDAVTAAVKALGGAAGSHQEVCEHLKALLAFLDHWDRARRTQLASAGAVGSVVIAAKAQEGSADVQLLAAVRAQCDEQLPNPPRRGSSVFRTVCTSTNRVRLSGGSVCLSSVDLDRPTSTYPASLLSRICAHAPSYRRGGFCRCWSRVAEYSGHQSRTSLSLQTIIRKFAEVMETSPDVKTAIGDSAVVSLLLKILEKHSPSAAQPQLGAEAILMTLGCAILMCT